MSLAPICSTGLSGTKPQPSLNGGTNGIRRVEANNETALTEPVDYEAMVDMFNRALIHTLRKHSVAGSFLDLWVPDADPVLGVASMVDSARIAGLTEIVIRFRRATVPADRFVELESALANAGRLTIEAGEGDSVLLRASGLQQTAALAIPASGIGPRRSSWQADVTGELGKGASPVPNRWDSADLPEFGDVHPHFRPQLQAALGRICREGKPAGARADLVEVTGQEGPVTLHLAIDPSTHNVASAHHDGAAKPSERAIIDLFCKAAENLPIQEVADHVGLKVLDALIDQDRPPPVGGVLLPTNAGAPFMLPPRLARKAYDQYRARIGLEDGTNFYYATPRSEWAALSAEQRTSKVEYVLRAFLQSAGLYPDDLAVLRIGKNKYGFAVRVMVGFSDRVAVADKPNLMRRLEQRLRRDLEPEIELVADRARDKSPLRRLS
jgi:hypothetical protein